MLRSGKLAFFAVILFALLPVAHLSAQDLNSVLRKLDAAAKDFHNTTATFEFDAIQTDPVPDTDVMTGTTYYERIGNHLQWAAHVERHNKQPSGRTYILSGGVLRESDSGKSSEAHPIDQASKYESYFMLGFGASGKELQDKWDITYLGPDKSVTTDNGTPTDKLELVAKDETVRRNIPKVTIWLDTARAVSVKQKFDEGEGMSRVCTYSNIKVNQPLPKDAFKFGK